MYTILANSVSEALSTALEMLYEQGIEESSRNGPVISMPGPVMVQYDYPRNHVLLSSIRDANPFFHFYEALWMLSGRQDVMGLTFYNKRMKEFSDDGRTFHGAYGYRWRSFFGYDQLNTIVNELKRNPQTRRCVLSMWNGMEGENPHHGGPSDLSVAMSGGKDVPCNTQAYFRVVNGRLDMTVTNRSNDVLWGAFGANAVHFGFLHEYVSNCAGIPQGRYFQISNNLHLYTNILPRKNIAVMIKDLDETDPYYPNNFNLPERNITPEQWQQAITAIKRSDYIVATWARMDHPFFRNTAFPIMDAWQLWKIQGAARTTLEVANSIQDPFWRLACYEWLERRVKGVRQ